jgi:DME family drug/metabolite transporter
MEQSISTPQSKRRGLWMVAIGGTLWGTVGPVTQVIYGLTSTTPLSVSFLRSACATPILLIACWWLLREKAFRIPLRDFGIMMLIGILTGLSQTAYFVAIPLAGVTISTLIAICLAPVSVALVSVIFRLEPFNRQVMVALGCALIGTVLVVGIEPGTALPHNALLGVFFSIGAGLTYAGVIVCGRFLANRAHPVQVNAIGFSTSTVMLLIIALLTNQLHLNYPVEGWLLLLYLGAIPTALGYGLFVAGMKSTPATIAGIVTLLEPVTAAIIAVIFFGERLTASGIFGALLLLGSIVVLARGE